MTDQDHPNRADPGAIVHFVGLASGAISAWLAASYLGQYSSPLVAVVVGGVAGLAGVFTRQNYREALATTIVAIVVAFVAYKFFAQTSLVRTLIIPAAIGFSTGDIAGATWMSLARGERSRNIDRDSSNEDD